MREMIMVLCTLILAITIQSMFKVPAKIYAQKTALEIKVLQHELKAYEEMDKELKSE